MHMSPPVYRLLRDERTGLILPVASIAADTERRVAQTNQGQQHRHDVAGHAEPLKRALVSSPATAVKPTENKLMLYSTPPWCSARTKSTGRVR